MDRNQTIGLVLMSMLLLGYFWFFSPKEELKKESPAKAKTEIAKPENTVGEAKADTLLPDSVIQQKYQSQFGSFAKAVVGEEKEIILENNDIQVVLSNRGARIKSVLLKKYLTHDKKKLYLVDDKNSEMTFEIPTSSGSINLNDLHFSSANQNTVVQKGDSGRVSFTLEVEPGKFIERHYTLGAEGFQLLSGVKTEGLDGVISGNDIKINWINKVNLVERDLEPTRLNTTINFYTADDKFDHLDESSTDPQTLNLPGPTKWVAMKQRFFTSSIIVEEPFASGVIKSSINPADTSTVKILEASLAFPASVLKDGETSFKYYFGPNNYQIAKKVTDGFGNNVYLGWTIFSTINKYLVIPIFNFLQQYIGNYGIIILILVLIIKLILFPLSYKSHISLAKTKVLKPELDEIKAKHGDDMQKVQAEQMQLYSKVGVNPLSGCIPMLLQMPIFLALYNFFPNSVELRQESLLWATDLSTYDSIATLPFTIPAYGDHVSLFCILMTISTLVYTWFNNQVTTVTGPMKSMQYVMPIVFLFFFNSLSAGLTYYYFINNLLTIFQQVSFRAFVDEKKIRQRLDENKVKNKDKKKSKFQERLENAMKQAETAKKVSETKKKK